MKKPFTALRKSHTYSGIEEIIEHEKRYPDIRDDSFVAGFMFLYGSAKMYDHARKLFDEMPQLDCQRSFFSFNALLDRCFRSERYDEIGLLFRELPEKLSIVPNLMSYNLAMKALCKAGSLYSAVLLMDEIEEMGLKRIFYNVRLRGLLKVTEVSKEIQLFEEIVNKGFKPDKFSYNNMIKTYVDERNLEQADMWCQKMVQNDCLLDTATFHMLIPLACDTKRFDFALHLCMKAIDSQVLVYRDKMQRVVVGLVQHSKIENAEELVELAKSCKKFRCELSLPLHN
ncbi:pentatricopeptide repeat-containing protein At1g55890, mitochondrial-like [Solanum dulcamara]|uniref:pentatricopeptide repeat-containing protein At1g55890, mitochondrial-like n=1 Tax=Solanum dulcamara TaxID=45834 RepID=UPI002485312C|nr:pentatricopeptide repeat-containing protein At1g55890, mitochondrial-like [Solanum dulcamara]